MEDLIPIEKLIEGAIKKGVNFGKGDPYNRLRYYTKLGLLPHMKRKSVGGDVVGHYPSYSLDMLVEIEKLKSLGLSNTEISDKLKQLTPKTGGVDVNALRVVRILTPSPKIARYLLFVIVGLLLLAGLGIVPIGKSKNDLIQKTLELDKKYILDSGSGYVPKNQTKVYVKSKSVKLNSNINVTFSSNFSPATRYWVSQKSPLEGFYLELDAPTSYDAEFSWWVSN